MDGRTLITAVLSLAALAAASAVHAESRQPLQLDVASSAAARDAFAPDASQWGPQAGRRSLVWDSKTGHWGFNLDLNQQVGRPLSFSDRDIQAGAFYKITPSLRLGGAVSLGSVSSIPQTVMPPPDKAPRVRLETSLKF
jgi:hypothetical protein